MEVRQEHQKKEDIGLNEFLKFDIVKEEELLCKKRSDSDWRFTGSYIMYAGEVAFKSKYYPQ